MLRFSEMGCVFRNKRGSFFTEGVEQAIGNLMATYPSSKGAKDVKAQSFMPHEDQPELSRKLHDAGIRWRVRNQLRLVSSHSRNQCYY